MPKEQTPRLRAGQLPLLDGPRFDGPLSEYPVLALKNGRPVKALLRCGLGYEANQDMRRRLQIQRHVAGRGLPMVLARHFEEGDLAGYVEEDRALCRVTSFAREMVRHQLEVEVAVSMVRRVAVVMNRILDFDSKAGTLFSQLSLTVEGDPIVWLERRTREWDISAAGFDSRLKPTWVPPEGIRGLPMQPSRVAFQLGLLLHVLLTAKHPFQGANHMESFQASFNYNGPQELPPLPSNGVPGLKAVHDQCLQADPKDRFASPQTLIAALDTLVSPTFDERPQVAELLNRFFPWHVRLQRDREERFRNFDFESLLRQTELSPDFPVDAITIAAAGLEPVVDFETNVGRRPASKWTYLMDVAPTVIRRPWPNDPVSLRQAEAPTVVDPFARIWPLSSDDWIDAEQVSVGEYLEFVEATERSWPAAWPESVPSEDEMDQPVTQIAPEDAAAYAAWRGGRLPTNDEWTEAMSGLPRRPDDLWEFTSDRLLDGHVVRGGRYRDQPTTPADWCNLSFESDPAPDVGFRCVVSAP